MNDQEIFNQFVDASNNGDTTLIERLISQGLDINSSDNRGYYPLHYATTTIHISVIKLLLEHGAEIDVVDENGNTPLSNAVFYCEGKTEAIKLLSQHGADPEKKNLHGISPRELADSIANYDYSDCF